MFRVVAKSSNFLYRASFLSPKQKSKINQTRSFIKSNYSISWGLDKIVVISMFPVIPAAFFLSDKFTDTLLAGLTMVHTHHGLMSIATDYIHKAPKLRKFFVRSFSALIFFGLFFMVHLRGQGVVMTVRRIWSIEPTKGNYYESKEYKI